MNSMKKNRKKMTLICLLCFSFLLTVIVSNTLNNRQVFRIGNVSCGLKEAKVYLVNYQNIYGTAYGLDLWQHDFGDSSLENYVKNITMRELAQVVCLDQLAKEKEMELSEEEKEKLTAEEIKVDNSDDFTASNAGNVSLKPKVPKPVTVTLEIRCDTLSQDMDRLENPAIKDYISEDGTILAKTTYKGTTDNTVFDAFNTLCRNNDIQLEFSYTPLYASYYIEGINYLYEFDGGPQSGWMYKVNEWFPNYGCSSYYLHDGDTIVWCYTCEGLGTDVGADEWMG